MQEPADLYETCDTESRRERRMRVTVPHEHYHGRSYFDRFSDTRIPLSDLRFVMGIQRDISVGFSASDMDFGNTLICVYTKVAGP
jgi:hypothetical protein